MSAVDSTPALGRMLFGSRARECECLFGRRTQSRCIETQRAAYMQDNLRKGA